MRKLIGIAINLVLMGVGYLGYVYIKDRAEYDSLSPYTKISLQLLPFPLIIANNGSKNDSLLELSLNKGKKTISIQHGNLEYIEFLCILLTIIKKIKLSFQVFLEIKLIPLYHESII